MSLLRNTNNVQSTSGTPGALNWVRTIDSSGSDSGYGVATDTQGNIFFTGNFTGGNAIILNGTTQLQSISTQSTGNSCSYVVKLDPSGGFLWYRTIDASTSTDMAYSIATDPSGCVYVTGYYDGPSGVYDNTTLLHSLKLPSNRAIYLVKFSPTGAVEWSRAIDGGSNEEPSSVATDSQGNVYVTGYMISASVFDGNTNLHTMSSGQQTQAFLLKLSSSGAFVWSRRVDGVNHDYANYVKCDSLNNVYLTGLYNGVATLMNEGGTTLHVFPTMTGNAGFIVKLGSDGSFAWSRVVDGANSDQGQAIACDLLNNVYFAGVYNISATLYNNTTPLHTLPIGQGDTSFIMKLDSSGNFHWARIVSGSGEDRANDLATDSQNNVYFVGYYSSDASVLNGTTSLHTLKTASFTNGFLVKFDVSGSLQFARSIAGEQSDYSRSVAVYGNRLYLAGWYGINGKIYDGNTELHTFPTAFSSGSYIVCLDTGTPSSTYVPYTLPPAMNTTSVATNAGQFQWLRVIDSSGAEVGNNIATDSQGNVFVTGVYEGTASIFDGASLVYTLPISAGYKSGYVVKLNASGGFQWVNTMDGIFNDEAFGITIDVSGNVLFTGYYTYNANIYNGSGVIVQVLRGFGGQAGFVVKLSSSGIFMWAGYTISSGYTVGYDVATDNQNNVIFVGTYSGTSASIYNQSGAGFIASMPNANDRAVFIIKYDSSGGLLWRRTIDDLVGTSSDNQTRRVTADSSGNVYVAGHYYSVSNVYNNSGSILHTLPAPSSGGYGAYLVKFDASGVFSWARTVDGTGQDYGFGLARDSLDNVYITGNYYGDQAKVYNNTTILYSIPAAFTGQSVGIAAFIVKFNSNGDFLWARTLGDGTSYCQSVACDSNNMVYVCGYYNSTPKVRADTTDLATLRTPSSNAVYVMKFNASGSFAWVRTIDGASSEFGSSISVDTAGRVHATGYYFANASVYDGNTIIHTLPAVTGNSAFIASFTTGETIQTSVPMASGFVKVLHHASNSNASITTIHVKDINNNTLATYNLGASSNIQLVWADNQWIRFNNAIM